MFAFIALFLLIGLASSQLSTPTAYMETFALCMDESPTLPFFDTVDRQGDGAVAVCTNDQYLSAQFSVRLFEGSMGGEQVTLTKTLALPRNEGFGVEVWVKFNDGVAPPLTNLFQVSYTGPDVPPTTRPLTLDPLDDPPTPGGSNWYKFMATFGPPAEDNTPGEPVDLTFVFTFVNVGSFSTLYIDDLGIGLETALIIGDPQFVGLRGQSYQVHGISNVVYNLVSSETTQVNSRFVFLDRGVCPIFDGIPASNCWAHPGSYLGEIGIQQIVDGVTHKLKLVSGAARDGFASVELDGQVLMVNETYANSAMFEVRYVSTRAVQVRTSDFAFTFENSDYFVNQMVQVMKPLSQISAHGLFGQTHKRATYPTSIKYIEGEVDDYVIGEDDLFGIDFIYNRFVPA